MSLWNKSASDITFNDIDTFCKESIPEGPRLDYKVDVPSNFAKTIAAFANTLGGLIILGVDASPRTNVPIWPSSNGMPFNKGISEKIGNIAQSIYPAVRVDVGNVIPNDHLPGTALVVVKVPESREAPHVVARKQVLVYERSNDTTECYGFADFDRIEQLLQRRNRLVDGREAELESTIGRAVRQLKQYPTPLEWVSASPVYPWRDVADSLACVEFHKTWRLNPWDGAVWRYQTVQRGSFATGRVAVESGAPLLATCVSSVKANGSLFVMTYVEECAERSLSNGLATLNDAINTRPFDPPVNLRNWRKLIEAFIEGCCNFYRSATHRPGEIVISTGMERAHGVVMVNSLAGTASNAHFPDDQFRADFVVDVERLLSNRDGVIKDVTDEIEFAFNANAWQPRR